MILSSYCLKKIPPLKTVLHVFLVFLVYYWYLFCDVIKSFIKVDKSMVIHSILLIFILWCNKELYCEILFFECFVFWSMSTLVKHVEGYVIIIYFFIFDIWSLVYPYLFNLWAVIISPFVASFVLIIDEMALEDSWLDLTKFVLADLLSLRFCIGICIHIKFEHVIYISIA